MVNYEPINFKYVLNLLNMHKLIYYELSELDSI